MSLPRFALNLLLISLTALLAGCTGLLQKYVPPAPSVANQAKNNVRSTILDAFQAQKGMSWRNQSDTITVDGNKGQTVIEFVPPDRYHITADGKTELIVIGSQVYMKQDQDWTKAQIPVEGLIDPEAFALLEKSITDVRYLGSETLDGKTMQVYQYQSLTRAGEGETTMKTRLWIGANDQLPYRLETEGEVTALDTATGKVEGVQATVIMQYAYDEGIQIADPGQ